ncbi:MAG TPA: hypothetical protein VGG69_07670 [Rhizomicrobium sp.]|jgi:hypothetical protein
MRRISALLITSAISVACACGARADSYGFATYAATINGKGNVLRSTGVQSSTRKSVGLYIVAFSRDVSACTYFGGPQGSNGGQVSVAPTGNPMRLQVNTFSAGGQRADLNFALLVSCSS